MQLEFDKNALKPEFVKSQFTAINAKVLFEVNIAIHDHQAIYI